MSIIIINLSKYIFIYIYINKIKHKIDCDWSVVVPTKLWRRWQKSDQTIKEKMPAFASGVLLLCNIFDNYLIKL